MARALLDRRVLRVRCVRWRGREGVVRRVSGGEVGSGGRDGDGGRAERCLRLGGESGEGGE